MEIGQTISPYPEDNVLYFLGPPVANKHNLQLVKCHKCPKCGHSEEIKSS
jgi:hypothetical protein